MLMKASNHESPMAALTRCYRITAVLAIIGFGICVRVLLYVENKPSAWLHFYACGAVVS